ncbi:ComF family protein [Massilia glaciei]|uniref:ComF family protein n=1 Tax=Massilia glaciei TaxID=1524097 RepID=A0A2U2HK36_9BURK|nr:ComF family protein [Massilia glaciei]PWF47805.1 ComF family protein [Massilia glaciei]
MQVQLKKIQGEWDAGFVLDQHSTGGRPDGFYANGHQKFDMDYTEMGAAVNQLKYHGDFSQVPDLAKAVYAHILPLLPAIARVVPMASSTPRTRQPVNAVAAYIAAMLRVPVEKGFLIKAAGSKSLKDLPTRAEKDAALRGKLSLARDLDGDGNQNILLVDDLFETGASLDAACRVLRNCEKISHIYVAALTWRRPR